MRRPDFFLVGAPRCGTTWLYEFLKSHPALFLPGLKEPHFKKFCSDLRFHNGIESAAEYGALFSSAPKESQAGEASVFYLCSTEAPARLVEFNPAAKALAILREPAEMIYSNFSKNISLGLETELVFEKALSLEESRTGIFESGAFPPSDYRKLLYRANARYGDQVSRYLERFGPDRFKVILFDDIVNRPEDLCREVCRFLGVEELAPKTTEAVNKNLSIRSKWLLRFLRDQTPAMKLAAKIVPRHFREILHSRLWRGNLVAKAASPILPETRRAINAELADQIELLERLIGRDLSAWRAH